jgi:hypothetical protein
MILPHHIGEGLGPPLAGDNLVGGGQGSENRKLGFENQK